MSKFVDHRIWIEALVGSSGDEVNRQKFKVSKCEVHRLRNRGGTVVDKKNIPQTSQRFDAVGNPTKRAQGFKDLAIGESEGEKNSIRAV